MSWSPRIRIRANKLISRKFVASMYIFVCLTNTTIYCITYHVSSLLASQNNVICIHIKMACGIFIKKLISRCEHVHEYN